MSHSSIKSNTFRRAFIFLALILTYVIQSRADDFTYNGLTYTVLTENTCQTKAGSSTNAGVGNSVNGDVVIPETVYDSGGNAYTVTKIGQYSFMNCTRMTSIAIPTSVTSSGNYAFDGCTELTKVTINDLVAWCSIAFSNNLANPLLFAHHLYLNDQEITELTIPYSITSIGDYAFYSCTGITSVTIPNYSVTSIGKSCFYNCEEMTAVAIGNSVTSIGNWAFGSCKKLSSITIPYSVTSIGDYGFWNCIGLQQITCLSSTPPTIAQYTFSDYSVRLVVTSNKYATANYWSNFTNVGDLVSKLLIGNIYYDIDGNTAKVVGCTESVTTLIIPSEITYNNHTYSVTSIESSAFEDRTELTSVDIPNSVTSIGEFAFYYCTGLTSVDIPNSVTSIGNCSFYGCSGLTAINVPSSVTSIDTSAFGYCSGLTKVNIEDLGAWCGISFKDDDSNPTYYAHHLYIDDNELTELDIPNSATSIGNYTFEYCTELTSVIIPESVTSIGSSAFEGCTGLTSVIVPESVTSIGISAFCGCSDCA